MFREDINNLEFIKWQISKTKFKPLAIIINMVLQHLKEQQKKYDKTRNEALKHVAKAIDDMVDIPKK